MQNSKKVLNDRKNVVPELIDGLVAAYHGYIKKLDGVGALIKNSLPWNKVGLLIGGGSGHEPLFGGFIGENMADGSACGQIFAAPSPDIILEVTRALDQGNGVLYVYGNYAGDNMNFDIAAEMAAEENMVTRTVRVWDDVASATQAKMQDRRGIAGDLFVVKVAGVASAVLKDLEAVYQVTAKARDKTRSIGVAVAAGSIPETGEPTFELPDDEIEIGMGLHGEPGVSREKMLPADALVDKMITQLVEDLPFQQGDEVCLLINDLGATTYMELLIANRRTHEILNEMGIRIYDTILGSYCTCQEMSGFSISMMKLDEELKTYYNMPADSLGFTKAAA